VRAVAMGEGWVVMMKREVQRSREEMKRGDDGDG
jgi:hypothetical protein